MAGFLKTKNKSECFGCEACVQICPKQALSMDEDREGFRYPALDSNLCIHCGLCEKTCPFEHSPVESQETKTVFGGYHKDALVRGESTSGGAFSALADSWCDENYVIFGAVATGLLVRHAFITDKSELHKFRKSKYSQSIVGSAYQDAKRFLLEGKKVLFSGTPCQLAGLKAYLGRTNLDNLLSVEVICEGVPSPHFVRKYDEYMRKKYGSSIETLDYRFKDMRFHRKSSSGKWDFQVMHTMLYNKRCFKKDRWFNPFWSIWLKHLMSRPSCYRCPFTTPMRIADLTLGDLWGVHIYCPELYGQNGGASLVICNSKKGKQALEAAKPKMYGHELDFTTALKYQSPMRKPIADNPKRIEFMNDLQVMDYQLLCRKWAGKPSLKLLCSKYIWGNRQKVFIWNMRQKCKK